MAGENIDTSMADPGISETDLGMAGSEPGGFTPGPDTSLDGLSPQSAPDMYDEFIIPEGMDYDHAAVDHYSPVLKKLNLTQEQAQELVDLRVRELQGMQSQFNQSMVQRNADWYSELSRDREFGGDKFDAHSLAVKRVLETFDPDRSFREDLQRQSLDNYPPLFKLLARMAPHFSEDTLVTVNDRPSQTDAPHNRMGWKALEDY